MFELNEEIWRGGSNSIGEDHFKVLLYTQKSHLSDSFDWRAYGKCYILLFV
jgi:hypothetical protein